MPETCSGIGVLPVSVMRLSMTILVMETLLRFCVERETKPAASSLKSPEPIEIVSILPPITLGDSEFIANGFWDIMRGYWGKGKVDVWLYKALRQEAVETCANRMCLFNAAAILWERARIALKSLGISDDAKEMRVQFSWLPRMQYSPRRPLTAIPCFDKNSLRQSPNDLNPTTKLFHFETDEKVQSGEVLTFRTDDPIRTPLPCFKLLETQWMLHRVLALSGEVYAPGSPLLPSYQRPVSSGTIDCFFDGFDHHFDRLDDSLSELPLVQCGRDGKYKEVIRHRTVIR